MFILMSSGWYCKEYIDIKDACDDAQEHIFGGNTVAFGDDIEYFAEQMKIDQSKIRMVD